MRFILLLACWLLATGPAARALSVRLATWSTLSDTNLSPLALVVKESEGSQWRYAESTRVLVHARSRAMLENTVEEAEFLWSAVGRALDLPDTSNRMRVVWVYDDATWHRLQKEGGVRPDGLALQTGHDVLIRVDTNGVPRVDRLAHEFVHFRLRDAYGDRLPLWLEEGLATGLGVEMARLYRNTRDMELTGELPGVASDGALTAEQLFGQKGYPPTEDAAQAFGRQAAEMVAVLRARIGPARWPDAVRTMAEHGDWRSALTSGYGIAMQELEQMASQAAQRAAQPWTF